MAASSSFVGLEKSMELARNSITHQRALVEAVIGRYKRVIGDPPTD